MKRVIFHFVGLMAALGIGCAGAQSADTPTPCDKASYMIFGSGGNGWIFEPWEFGDNIALPAVDELKVMQAAFEKRGAQLVMVPVPSRPSKYISKIDLRKYPNLKFSPQTYQTTWEAMIDAARSSGTSVVNLLPNILSYQPGSRGESFFYPRDHHWTTSGAEVAAGQVAAEIKRLIAARGMKLKAEDVSVKVERAGFNSGSFADRYFSLCGTKSDIMPAYKATLTVKGGGLLDDEDAVVGVFGDSFGLASPDNNFAPFLEAKTGLRTVNYSLPGAGSFGSLTGYLADPKFVGKLPKFVVVPFLGSISSDPTVYRQVTAELDGCAKPASKFTLDGTSDAPFSWANVPALGQRGAVHLHLGAPTQKVELTLGYDDGSTEKVTLNRPGNDWYKGNRTDFYLALAKGRTLKTVSVRADDKPAKLTGQLCALDS
ncbi:alginate O-acetyltransferase AlgX-related protein [Deinococcus pimensis]|uniref:alginate O-acetyltransferase AlgX-related protein n=1 Tax=Deinococcus pimensis TaxID=309888 RepID=UPI0004846A88|nr:hypothetical protein [Deinococcus pimensis]